MPKAATVAGGGPSPRAEDSAEAEPPEPLNLAIVREGGDWSGFEPAEEAVRRAAAALGRRERARLAPGSAASVVLAADDLVQRLNRTYRGKDAPTNVLSFPYRAPPGAAGEDAAYLGDVVLAAETVAREAAQRGLSPLHHLQHLVVHGLLHLLGHDHDSEASAAAMEALEAEILAGIGVADPYAAPPGS